MKLYMFRTVRLSIIRHQTSDIPDSQLYRITSTNPGPALKLSTNLYEIHHCRFYSE